MIAPCLELPSFAKYCKVCVCGVVFNIAYTQVTSVTESQRYGEWLLLTVEKNTLSFVKLSFFCEPGIILIYLVFIKSQ